MKFSAAILRTFVATRRSFGFCTAVLRSGRACRASLLPSRKHGIKAIEIGGMMGCNGDPFYFLTDRFYLSRRLSWKQRLGCAIDHYEHEGRHRSNRYLEQVYRSSGLVLWEKIVNGTRYTIRLAVSRDNRLEAELSVLMYANDDRVCWMGFSFVDAGTFGRNSGVTMFITRSQAHRNDASKRFSADFKQNSPPFFCLAAMIGIAKADGLDCIFAIRHDAQISYKKVHHTGFVNSYDNLWLKLGAEPADEQAFRLGVPLDLKPTSEVKHKSRALARRKRWAEIEESACRAMMASRRATGAAFGMPPTVGAPSAIAEKVKVAG